MRVFVAADINDEVRKALAKLQERLKADVDIRKGDVKWVDPETMHLTLKFIGETRDEKIVEICNIVKDVAGRHGGFELDIESVGWFGGKAARVLWVGTGRGSENLGRLQQDVEMQLASAGWLAEPRQFSGHLTLCRIRNAKAGAKLAAASEGCKEFPAGTVLVDSVSVYQSLLTPSGPVYTVLGNYKLQ